MNEPKNIVIVGPAYPLRGGGMATFNERMARALMSLGHRVTIYTFSLQYPSFLFPGKTQLSEEAPPADLDIRVKINSVWPPNWLLVGNEIKKQRPDLVIVRYWLPFMGPCLGTILRQVRKNHFSEIVCIADNILPHEKRPGDLLFTKYFLPPVHRFVVMSKKVLADLKAMAPNKSVALVKHPLYDNFGEALLESEAKEQLQLEQDQFVILFFGFIRKYKGLDMLLRAMPAVLQKIPNAKLVIAGEFYEDQKTYTELIQELQLEPYLVLRTGFVADAHVPIYFSAADVVVQPYRNATQSGVTPLAYHFELPMVVTNVGGLPEMVPNKTVGLVAEPNPADIAEKIIQFHQLGKAHFVPGIRQLKTEFSWDTFCRRLLNG